MRSLGVAAALAVVACSNGEDKTVAQDDAKLKEAAAIRQARERVVKALRDPDSARFRGGASVDLGPWAGATVRISCGYVNARNGYGGYGGEQPWYVVHFQDGSSGVCLGQAANCTYMLTPEIKKSGDDCVASLGD